MLFAVRGCSTGVRCAYALGVLVLVMSASLAAAQPPGTMIHGFRHGYSPYRTVVPPGAQIVFLNLDPDAHTLTFDNGTFDIKLGPTVNDTDHYENITLLAPMTPGEYPFHCQYHAAQGMRGVLVVKEGAPGYVPSEASKRAPGVDAWGLILVGVLAAFLPRRCLR